MKKELTLDLIKDHHRRLYKSARFWFKELQTKARKEGLLEDDGTLNNLKCAEYFNYDYNMWTESEQKLRVVQNILLDVIEKEELWRIEDQLIQEFR